jgi:hypothetical protein
MVDQIFESHMCLLRLLCDTPDLPILAPVSFEEPGRTLAPRLVLRGSRPSSDTAIQGATSKTLRDDHSRRRHHRPERLLGLADFEGCDCIGPKHLLFHLSKRSGDESKVVRRMLKSGQRGKMSLYIPFC